MNNKSKNWIIASIIFIVIFTSTIVIYNYWDDHDKQSLLTSSKIITSPVNIENEPETIQLHEHTEETKTQKPIINQEVLNQIEESEDETINIIIESKDKERIKKLIREQNGRLKKETDRFLEADIDADKIKEIIQDDDSIKIYPNRRYSALLSESVPLIGANDMWDSGYNGSDITIAILDTGIDTNHEMFEGRIISSKDFTNSSGVEDVFGHGTHVAGIAAGNGKYKGVAPGAKILNAKVLADDGSGNTADIVAGIEWAVQEEADIISMSLGGPYSSPDELINLAIEDAVNQGTIVVVSAGNCGTGCPSSSCGGFRGVTSPGDSPYAITVGAVNNNKEWACFSGGEIINNMIKPDVVAPGVNITSSITEGYASKTGTSMSAPHISGAIALLLQKHPTFGLSDVKNILTRNSEDLGESGKDIRYGDGLINITKFLQLTPISDIEYDVSYIKTLMIDEEQRITFTAIDNITVLSINGSIEGPDETFNLNFNDVGHNSFESIFSDTQTPGIYSLNVNIQFQNKNEELHYTFHILGNSTEYGKIESITAPSTINYNSQLELNIEFTSLHDEEMEVYAEVEVIDILGEVSERLRSDQIILSAGETSLLNINKTLTLSPEEYTLNIGVVHNNNIIFNETPLKIRDNVAPVITGLSYRQVLDNREPLVVKTDVTDHSDLNGYIEIIHPLGYTERINFSTYQPYTLNKSLAATYENTLAEGTYRFYGQICDTESNCADIPENNFNVQSCTGKHLLLVTTDKESIFNRTSETLCTARWNRKISPSPPPEYLERFDAIIWSSGSNIEAISREDAESIQEYLENQGNIVFEGEELAYNRRFESILPNISHSDFKEDLLFSAMDNPPESVSIYKSFNHPIIELIPSEIPFNTSLSAYPDSVVPTNGGVELMRWENGSAMVAYNNGSKVLFIPFTLEAIGTEYGELIARNSLDWMIDDGANIDVKVADIEGEQLHEGTNAITAVIHNSGSQNAENVRVEFSVDGIRQEAKLADVPAGGSVNVYATLVMDAGDESVNVELNSDRAFEESNYLNNFKEKIMYFATAEADLSPHNLSYDYSDGVLNLSVFVRNIGGTPAYGADVYLYLDGELIEKKPVIVNPYGSYQQVNFNHTIEEGIADLSIVVNPTHKVIEYNYMDNYMNEEIFLCHKESVLIVDDNGKKQSSTEAQSATMFKEVLLRNGYCVDQSDSNDLTDLDTYDLIIWSTSQNWEGILENHYVLNSYQGNILFEGSDIAFDKVDDDFMITKTYSVLDRDLILNSSTALNLTNHTILKGISKIVIDGKIDNYPDSIIPVESTNVASWPDAESAIIAKDQNTTRTAYFAFSVEAVTENNTRNQLILNSVAWLLNSTPSTVNITYTDPEIYLINNKPVNEEIIIKIMEGTSKTVNISSNIDQLEEGYFETNTSFTRVDNNQLTIVLRDNSTINTQEYTMQSLMGGTSSNIGGGFFPQTPSSGEYPCSYSGTDWCYGYNYGENGCVSRVEIASGWIRELARPCLINGVWSACYVGPVTVNLQGSADSFYLTQGFNNWNGWWDVIVDCDSYSTECSIIDTYGTRKVYPGIVTLNTPPSQIKNYAFSAKDLTECTDYTFWSWYAAGYADPFQDKYSVLCLDDSDCGTGRLCDNDGDWRTWRCVNDPCNGVDTSNRCEGDILKYNGQCNNGVVTYSEATCQFGCENGQCLQDPCAGVTCDDKCEGFDKYTSGQCSAGQCNYNIEYNSTECGFVNDVTENVLITLKNGPKEYSKAITIKIVENPCLGVTCDDYCDSYTSYSDGRCEAGECRYDSITENSTTCGWHEPACYTDADCGASGWNNNKACNGDDIFDDYTTMICLNPGTQEAECAQQVESRFNESCYYGCKEGECLSMAKIDPYCGQSIIKNSILTDDLENCPYYGLVIKKDNTILDCGGHSITGSSENNKYGIYAYNRTNVTIQNCNVSGFGYTEYMIFEGDDNQVLNSSASFGSWGIYAQQTDNFMAKNIVVTNASTGIHLAFHDKVVIDNLKASGGFDGIKFSEADNIEIKNSILTDNTYGIYKMTSDSFKSLIHDNLITGNNYGLMLSSSNFNDKIYHNAIYNNSGHNAYITDATEISYNNEGNYWGHNAPPFFTAGADSNKETVKDSHPYGKSFLWGEWPAAPGINSCEYLTCDEYCDGTTFYSSGSCADEQCTYTNIDENSSECTTPICYSDADCPAEGSAYDKCIGTDVYSATPTSTCINPGTPQARCDAGEEYQLEEDCRYSCLEAECTDGYLTHPYCGMYVSVNTVLNDDLYCNTTTIAIRIMKDNVHLDCNEHTIYGDGKGWSALFTKGYGNVHLENCNVDGFTDSGISIRNSRGSRIESTTITNIGNAAIGLMNASNFELINSSSSHANTGFQMSDTDNVTISGFTSLENNFGAIINGNNNVMTGSVLVNNSQGLAVYATNSYIYENLIKDNAFGLKISNAPYTNHIYHNAIYNNTQNTGAERNATAELSYDYAGNYWGHNTPPLFREEDTTHTTIWDSHPYGRSFLGEEWPAAPGIYIDPCWNITCDDYCEGYTSYVNGHCSEGICTYQTEFNSTTCGWHEPACYSNTDCGEEQWGNAKCMNDKVYRLYGEYTCSNPGTINASCSYSSHYVLNESCKHGCENAVCMPFSYVMPECGMKIRKNSILTDNLINCSLYNAIVIDRSDVFLDCDGHSIINHVPNIAISASGKNNITIRNCRISTPGKGIDWNIIMNSTIYNSSIDAQNIGLHIKSSKGLNIFRVQIQNSQTAVLTNQLYNSLFDSLTISDNGQGISMSDNPYSYNNITIRNSEIRNNSICGIGASYCLNLDINNNRIKDNAKGICGELNSSRIYTNAIYNNSINIYSTSSANAEISYENRGNYWGHSTPPFFTESMDSNRLGIIDSHPYGKSFLGEEWPAPPGIEIDPCWNVTCNDYCDEYTSHHDGICNEGICTYQITQNSEICEWNLCVNITCDDKCEGYTSYFNGQCGEGMCTYDSELNSEECGWINPCANVICDDLCDGTTLRFNGICNEGQCEYQTESHSSQCGWAPICSKDEDCGSPYWKNTPFCSPNNVYDIEITPKCIITNNAPPYCSESIESREKEICDYECANGECKADPCANIECNDYCDGFMLYHNGQCENGECRYQREDNSEQCNWREPTCYTDSDCGNIRWQNQPFCSDNSVYDTKITPKCINTGTQDSFCEEQTTSEEKKECDERCENGQCINDPCAEITCEDYCDDYKFYYGGYCEYGVCTYSVEYNSDSCDWTEPQCSSDADCGASEWDGEPYCIGNRVYDKLIVPYCFNAGNENAECKTRTNSKSIETCEYGCNDGICNADPCKDIRCYDYCEDYTRYIDGTCSDGECQYSTSQSNSHACGWIDPEGCENGGSVTTRLITNSPTTNAPITIRVRDCDSNNDINGLKLSRIEKGEQVDKQYHYGCNGNECTHDFIVFHETAGAYDYIGYGRNSVNQIVAASLSITVE